MALTKQQKLNKIMNDFTLFAKNFIYIIDTSGKKVKLELNTAQAELHDLMQDNRFVVVAKSRKCGISTMMLAMALWRATKNSDETIVIVSYDGDSSRNLFEILKKMNDNLPRDKYPSLFPKVKRDNRNELFMDNGSKIICTVAGYKDLIRGFSPTWVHLSEFAFYQNQEKQLLSVEQALIDNGQISIETTSNGMNYYYKLYNNAMKGKSKYKPYFVPWYHEFYKKSMKNQYDEAEKYYKETNSGRRLSPDDLDDYEMALYKQGVTLKQLMFRRFKLLDMELSEFQQEMPSNYIESFTQSGNNVFDQAKVLERLNYTIEPIERKYLIDELPVILHRYINKGLYIYHLPKRGIKYYGGIDTASGGGGDYSTISIFDSEGQQCMSFYHNKVPVYLFAEIVNEIGRYFNYCFYAIERNSYGLPLIERLRKDYNYLNLYKQKIFDQKGKRKMQLGFMTTTATKPILISDFKEQFEKGLINIECKETLQQMQIFQENANGSMGNKKGAENRDDLCISCSLAVAGMKQGKYYVD